MSKLAEERLMSRSNTKENAKFDALPEIGSVERLAAERKLLRKLDMRLLPTIFLIFIMNYIDRNGITTARLKAFNKTLGYLQYSVVLSVLFASYCPAQVPSNMILNYITRPSWFIGLCVIAWGLTSALTGVTKGYSGVLACRIFIGLPEAAFYPGAIYLLSRWYTKKELAFRSAVLYSGLLLSNAFAALMAAGILGRMDGNAGAITIVVGFFQHSQVPLLILSQPGNTNWIVGDERRLAQARLAEDAGEADQDTENDTPPRVTFALMTTSQLLGLSFISFFPTLLLAAPPWLLSGVICCLNAWHADKTGERFFHITGWWWAVMIGFIISLSTTSTGARYFSMFLMSFGYVGFALTLVWVSNSIPRPPAKRAAALGIVNGVGNLGNLMGSYVWKGGWGPKYHQSMVVSLLALFLSSLLSLGYVWRIHNVPESMALLGIRQHLLRKNRKLDADAMQDANENRVKEAAILEGISFEQALERRKGFRYLH
ncbi:major facilitator superfamily domain-containing protein [Mycena olivaceomarginata]|nr:major facilitator superfamily domain-containing protein [Mycena olivaceomarginata]